MGIEFEYQVSFIQLCAGLVLSFLPAILTEKLSAKYGLLRSLSFLCFSLVPVCISLGLCGFLPEYLNYIGLSTVFMLSNCCVSVAIFYISICISNTVTRNILATANGFSQAIVGISRFISTSLFGLIYGWSVSDGLENFGVNAKFSCFLMSFFPAIDAFIIIFCIDKSVEKKKTEENKLELKLLNKN